jgi:hypothetical protein
MQEGLSFPLPPYRRSYSLDISDSGGIYLLGGCADDKNAVRTSRFCLARAQPFSCQVFDDLWRQDQKTGRWSYVCKQPGSPWPRPRYGHATVFVPRSAPGPFAGCLVVYGGRSQGGVLLGDLWAWNEQYNAWRDFLSSAVGDRPPPSCYSTVTLVENGRLVLFGGQTAKSARGSKLLWICENGNWSQPPVPLNRQRRFRHAAWYNHALKLFCIYGGISGHAWHVDVCVLPLEERSGAPSSWRVLPSPSGLAVSGHAIQSEVCVVLDANFIMAIGATYVHVLQVSSTSIRLVGSLDELPPGWKGNSPGVNACLVDPNQVLAMNLLPKIACPMLRVQWNSVDGSTDAALVSPPTEMPITGEAVCHDPPRCAVPAKTRPGASGVSFSGTRWEKWDRESSAHFFMRPNLGASAGSSAASSRAVSRLQSPAPMTNVVSQSFREGPRGASDEEGEGLEEVLPGRGPVNINSDATLDEMEEDESMPLLFVRQQKQRSVLKRLIDAMLSWEKRGAVEAHKKHPRKHEENSMGDDVKDDEHDLDCFGRQDDRHEFDWRHFFFTLVRGFVLILFAIVYLFSSRFTWRAKLMLMALGVVNVGVIAIPVVTYTTASSQNLQAEIALVWAPLIFYILVVFVHSTVEGNWRDSGGSAASLNYLDSYECKVFLKQTVNSSKRTSRDARRRARVVSYRVRRICHARPVGVFFSLLYSLAPHGHHQGGAVLAGGLSLGSQHSHRLCHLCARGFCSCNALERRHNNGVSFSAGTFGLHLPPPVASVAPRLGSHVKARISAHGSAVFAAAKCRKRSRVVCDAHVCHV